MKTSLLTIAFLAAFSDLFAQTPVNSQPAVIDSQGTAGQINITGGLGWYPRLGSSLSVNHRQKEASFYVLYSVTSDKTPQQISNECTSPVGDGFSHMAITMNRVVTQTNHSLRIGADLNLGQKTTLGLLVSGFNNESQIDAHYRMLLEQSSNQSEKTSPLIDGQMLENRRWQQRMANVSLRHQLAPGHTLSVDIDYLTYTDTNLNRYVSQNADEPAPETGTARQNVTRQTPIHIYVVKTHYVRPVGQQNTLEVGLKASQLALLNQIDRHQLTATGWQSDVAFSRNDRLKERIGAVYTNLTTRFSDKTTLIAGLRAEYTNSQMYDALDVPLLDRRYISLLPNLSFTHKLRDTERIELGYDRQITRSPLDAIASFNLFWDPLFATGNPSLRPAFADVIRVSYTKNQFTLALLYSREQNQLSRFAPFIHPINNAIGFGPGNLGRSDALTLTLNLPVTIRPWWQTQNSLVVTHGQNSLTLQHRTYHIGQVGGQFNTDHTFRLPHDFKANVTVWYATSTVNEFGYLWSRGEVTASVQKKLANNRGTLTASISDLFWTNQIRSVTSVPELRLDNRTTFALNEPRIVRLTYTRSFGKAGIKVTSQRIVASDDERKRVN
ncbi:outer membrane beta-barrel family protein [Spirosoma sp. KNUC1025]|uniref:outer membrane beta-barrel family protein n=1 Tax=Spirosoma sp. KNUC1025 TaxID=2894082 RepID=UPI00386E5FF4|nr:outer membrane beta-barrel family protein [Spirosoma sp. KNUC1025]